MAIATDFAIDYANKRVYHNSGTTVYNVNQLYSWLMGTFDDLGQMDDQVPISAQTPTEYTLINGWFMDDDSIKYLKGGAIQTNGWGSGAVRNVKVATGYTGTPTIGATVTTASSSGVLLAYQLSEDGLDEEWFIRPSTPVGSNLFATNSEAITTSGVTGATTIAAGVVSTTGESLWANIYTLGTIASDPYTLAYVKRGDPEIIHGKVLDNVRADSNKWYDYGHIDVLVKVKESSTFLDNGVITVYARNYGDLYDQFDITLTAGGRNAVPLATSTDLDNATGSHYLLASYSVIPQIGEWITSVTGFRAEVMGVTDFTGTCLLELGNVIVGSLASGNALTGALGGAATAIGTVGDTYFPATVGTALTVGLVITGSVSTATRIVRGVSGNNVVCQVQATPVATDYLQFTISDTVTDTGTGSVTPTTNSVTVVSGFSNIKLWFVNYYLQYASKTGTFIEGEIVTQAVTGASGTFLYDDLGGIYLANKDGTWFNTTNAVTGALSGATFTPSKTGFPKSNLNQAFTQGLPYTYKMIVDCAGRRLSEMYAYLKFVTGDGSGYSMHRTTDLYPTVYAFDSNTGYTDLSTLVAAAVPDSFTWFDATTPANGDAVYFGQTVDFQKVEIEVTSGALTASGIVWQYWNGAWTNLPNVYDAVTGTTAGIDFTVAAEVQVSWDMPSDWVATSVNGSPALFWIRAIDDGTRTGGPARGGWSLLGGAQQTVPGKAFSEVAYGFVPVKQAPFGTFAGGTFFGARGVWIQNMHADDIQSYQLKDKNNATRTPPNFQSITVSNLVSGDTVGVFKTLGGVIDKAQFASHATANSASSTTYTIATTIPSDTPSTGFIRIVNTTTGVEERIAYTSWTGSAFTLSSAHAGGYGASDTAYVGYIDGSALSANETVSLIYAADRSILTRVRRYNGAGDSILPFEAPGTFGSTGYAIATIRTDDAIVGTF